MAVVLKATQEVPAVSALGSYSLLGTLAKSEILDTQGNVTSLGEIRPSESEFDDWGFSESFQRLAFWSPGLSDREYRGVGRGWESRVEEC